MGRACQESSSFTRICPSPFCRSSVAPKLCTEIQSRVWPRLLPEQEKKRTKVYHPLPMSYTELLPILIQNYEISAIPARPRRPPYPKKYDVNAKCEYHGKVGGTPWRIAQLSKTRFNCWSMQIQSNSKDLSTVTRRIKTKGSIRGSFCYECFHLWMYFLKNVSFALILAFTWNE